MKTKTSQLEQRLKKTSKHSLAQVLKDIPFTDFVGEVERMLTENNMIKSDIIKQTTLDRNYAYQILSGERIPSKDKVIQLSLALKCSLEETDRLLKLSDNSPLYAKVKRDATIIFAINEKYTVMETDELLLDHKFEKL